MEVAVVEAAVGEAIELQLDQAMGLGLRPHLIIIMATQHLPILELSQIFTGIKHLRRHTFHFTSISYL